MSEEKIEEKEGFTNEQRFYLWLFSLVCLTVFLILGLIFKYNADVKTKAMENGYVQDTVKGDDGIYWVKKCEPTKLKE